MPKVTIEDIVRGTNDDPLVLSIRGAEYPVAGLKLSTMRKFKGLSDENDPELAATQSVSMIATLLNVSPETVEKMDLSLAEAQAIIQTVMNDIENRNAKAGAKND